MSDQVSNPTLPVEGESASCAVLPELRAAAPSRILYVLSVAGPPTASLYRALALARLLDSELHVLCVLPGEARINVLFPHRSLDCSRVVSLSRTANALTREWMRDVLGRRLPPGRFQVRDGNFVAEVAAHAAEIGAGLIVMSPGAGRFGNLVTRLARRAQVPVLVARPSTPETTIVAATDLEDGDYPVLRSAAALGAKLGAPVIAVHNVTPLSSPPYDLEAPQIASQQPSDDASEQEERLSLASLRLHIDSEAVVVRETDSAEAILFEARCRGADIIVMGTRDRPWFDRLLSPSVAADVVERASRSVLVTPLGTRAHDATGGL